MGRKSNGVYVFVLEMCVLDFIEVEYVCEVSGLIGEGCGILE